MSSHFDLDDSASLELLDVEHRQILGQAVKNILNTDVAEFTYAQILDGLPTEKSVRESFSYVEDHPAGTANHDELCPGFIDKARKFRAEFQSSQLRFHSQVNPHHMDHPQFNAMDSLICSTDSSCLPR
jgi:hypothetical protein